MPLTCAMGLALKDITDSKAFYPCVVVRAKSHFNWAEAFTDSSCFLVSVGTFVGLELLGFKSNEESKFCFFANSKQPYHVFH
ncbi:hypothetical protein [Sphingobacterium sp.]|uniref:hypothetical protein n=1 Tax=Sphingobacterium sp. TaxID=341027 RepID=UPI0028B22CEC|nr:hypothetical protein [Sphingobacterium sp.]